MKRRRERRIERIRQRLLRKSLPRLVMTVIVSLTGLSAFLVSITLLWAGVLKMWIRYPAALLLAYVVFLILLAAWLWLQRRSLGLDVLEVPDFTYPLYERSERAGDALPEAASHEILNGGPSNLADPISNRSSGSLDSLALDLDEVVPLVLAVVLISCGLCASLYVIYIAPALLAEILVDGALIAGLYRRVRRIEQRHWLRAAVRRTALPLLVAAVLFAVAGYLLQRAVPDALTIGEVWEYRNR